MGHQITALSRVARSRGEQIAGAVCAWVRRWGYSSDSALASLYPGRPRLGYDMWRRGLLTRHAVPPGYRVTDGRQVYGLTPAGVSIAEEMLPPLVLDIEHSGSPAWSSMQHLLDCQRYAIALGMLPAQIEWRSEPELRATTTGTLVPDMLRIGERLWWIEIERSPKKDMALDYWVQRIARYQARAINEGNPESKSYITEWHKRKKQIERLIIIVPTEYQNVRYEKMVSRAYAEPIARDPDSRQLYYMRDQPRLQLGTLLGTMSVEIWSVARAQYEIIDAQRAPDAQRAAVLDSRYIPPL